MLKDKKVRGEQVRALRLQDDGTFPNHPFWPLLVYPGALDLAGDDPAGVVERVFGENGWGQMWRDGVYPFHHYHSNAHEALGVYQGSARVQFGGPQGPEIELQAGDVAILPAGTVHRNLGSSSDLGVVGAYPPGPAYDLCRGEAGEHARALARIRQVPKPAADPVFGKAGGLCTHWRPSDG